MKPARRACAYRSARRAAPRGAGQGITGAVPQQHRAEFAEIIDDLWRQVDGGVQRGGGCQRAWQRAGIEAVKAHRSQALRQALCLDHAFGCQGRVKIPTHQSIESCPAQPCAERRVMERYIEFTLGMTNQVDVHRALVPLWVSFQQTQCGEYRAAIRPCHGSACAALHHVSRLILATSIAESSTSLQWAAAPTRRARSKQWDEQPGKTRSSKRYANAKTAGGPARPVGASICVMGEGHHRACGARSPSGSGRPKRSASNWRSLHYPSSGPAVVDRSSAATAQSHVFQLARAYVSRSRESLALRVSNGPSILHHATAGKKLPRCDERPRSWTVTVRQEMPSPMCHEGRRLAGG